MKQDKLETITSLFEDSKIRSEWDSEKEEYYFSVVDVISALTNSSNPRNYWNMLKSRLDEEGSEVYANCVQFKLLAKDGKYRKKILCKQKKQKICNFKSKCFKLQIY